jgi:hypothetical protein
MIPKIILNTDDCVRFSPCTGTRKALLAQDLPHIARYKDMEKLGNSGGLCQLKAFLLVEQGDLVDRLMALFRQALNEPLLVGRFDFQN